MPRIINVNYLDRGWLSVKAFVPPMFEYVLVYGCVKQEHHYGMQPYKARRFSGVSGIDDGLKTFEWLTTHDYIVRNVEYWKPFEEPKPEEV